MMRLYRLSKRMLPPRSQIASILPLTNALELAMINVPMVMLTAASVNMALERAGMDALDIKIIAEIRLMIPARIAMPPNTVRPITKVDFLNTD